MARQSQGHEDKAKEIRELAEKGLRAFAKLVNPLRVTGRFI